MKDPCEDCLIKVCCEEYCVKKYAYNKKIKGLYRKNKDKHLFEKTIDDVTKLFRRKYPDLSSVSNQQIKEAILLK